MKRTPSTQRPQAVLFACGLNSVRSPMAAALLRQALGTSLYVASAGVRKGELDVFAVAVMDESGIDIKAHRPMTFEELDDLEGLNFDHHALPRSAPQGARAHAHARGRRRVLAHRRSDRDRREPGAAHECVPRRARPTAATDQDAFFPAPERQ
jgi:low molecular weight phosphotyrosine protein phosphatase